MPDLCFGPFTLDPLARQLRRADNPVPLPAKAFDLLLLMAQNPGRPLTKKELLRTVWADTHVDESNLSQSISVLRKALGAEGGGTLITLPGVGYQFAGRVKEAAPAQTALYPLTFRTTESHLLLEEVTEERVRWWTSPLALTLASIGLVALCVAGWLGWERYEDRVGGPPVQVVVTELEGSTGDAGLDRTLSAVFRMKLSQSPYVTILSGSNTRAKLLQMQHKAEDVLTPALAREVCERTGSQAVVHGTVARAGAGYLLTEEATNCVDGAVLGQASRSVARADDVPAALGTLADAIRHDLGESRRNIARFNQPLPPVTTGSLEALKDLTEAERLLALGRGQEAVDLLKQSVVLDPNFAGGWLDLSTYALNNRQRKDGEEYLTKAYNLRQYATEPTRRLITARYNGEVTGDVYESLRNYQTWVDEYPRNVNAWSGMTVVDRDLGRTADELNAAQHLMAINQVIVQIFQVLAEAQMRSGHFTDARTTLQNAIAKGLDGDVIRTDLLKIGHLRHDPVLVAEQEAWALQHPFSPYTLAVMADYAEIEGRSDEADRLLALALDACRHSNNDALYSDILAQMLTDRSGLGQLERAKVLLTQIKADPANPAYLYALQYAGQGDKVESLLKTQLAARPRSTKWNEEDGPTLRGKQLLDTGKPREALTALAPTRPHDDADIDAVYLRGMANLQLKQLSEAEVEFRKIIDHAGCDPAAWQRPMAMVQLARTLARQGRKADAAKAYRSFLTGWEHAGKDQPLLLQVRKELQVF